MKEARFKLYHITYLFNLESIIEQGLLPGSGQVFGGGYQEHSKGRVFLTEEEGVKFWWNQYENQIIHLTDDPTGWIPIVMEIDLDEDYIKLRRDKTLRIDIPGSQDSGAIAYYTTKTISPDHIVAIWDSTEWIDPEDVDIEEILSYVEDYDEDLEPFIPEYY